MNPLAILGLTAGGVLEGALNGRARKQESESTTTRNLLPEQRAALESLFGFGNNLITGYDTGLDAERATGAAGINQQYTTGLRLNDEEMARRGIRPDSGVAGAGVTALTRARGSSISALDAYIARARSQQRFQGADILSQILGQNFGSTTKSKGSISGNVLGGAASGGLGVLGHLIGQKE